LFSILIHRSRRLLGMVASRRAQILMDPKEYAQLEKLARRRHVSVAELIRRAVRQRYLGRSEDRRKAVERICGMEVHLEDWPTLESEIAEAHDGGGHDLP
jgi:hypothetical protein